MALGDAALNNVIENSAMPLGHLEAGLPGGLRGLDGCRAPADCSFLALRDDRKPAEVVRET
jgi:hypothetical protein